MWGPAEKRLAALPWARSHKVEHHELEALFGRGITTARFGLQKTAADEFVTTLQRQTFSSPAEGWFICYVYSVVA